MFLRPLPNGLKNQGRMHGFQSKCGACSRLMSVIPNEGRADPSLRQEERNMSSSPGRGTTLKPMPGTYTAVEVSAPSELRLVERRVVEPGPSQVRIRVEACGVCHSDSATVEGLFPIDWPRVPGHDAVGRIDALGPGVQGWAVGQRVGVGFLGGSCGYCEFCRNGDLVNCRNQEFTGVHSDGG